MSSSGAVGEVAAAASGSQRRNAGRRTTAARPPTHIHTRVTSGGTGPLATAPLQPFPDHPSPLPRGRGRGGGVQSGKPRGGGDGDVVAAVSDPASCGNDEFGSDLTNTLRSSRDSKGSADSFARWANGLDMAVDVGVLADVDGCDQPHDHGNGMSTSLSHPAAASCSSLPLDGAGHTSLASMLLGGGSDSGRDVAELGTSTRSRARTGRARAAHRRHDSDAASVLDAADTEGLHGVSRSSALSGLSQVSELSQLSTMSLSSLLGRFGRRSGASADSHDGDEAMACPRTHTKGRSGTASNDKDGSTRRQSHRHGRGGGVVASPGLGRDSFADLIHNTLGRRSRGRDKPRTRGDPRHNLDDGDDHNDAVAADLVFQMEADIGSPFRTPQRGLSHDTAGNDAWGASDGTGPTTGRTRRGKATTRREAPPATAATGSQRGLHEQLRSDAGLGPGLGFTATPSTPVQPSVSPSNHHATAGALARPGHRRLVLDDPAAGAAARNAGRAQGGGCSGGGRDGDGDVSMAAAPSSVRAVRSKQARARVAAAAAAGDGGGASSSASILQAPSWGDGYGIAASKAAPRTPPHASGHDIPTLMPFATIRLAHAAFGHGARLSKPLFLPRPGSSGPLVVVGTEAEELGGGVPCAPPSLIIGQLTADLTALEHGTAPHVLKLDAEVRDLQPLYSSSGDCIGAVVATGAVLAVYSLGTSGAVDDGVLDGSRPQVHQDDIREVAVHPSERHMVASGGFDCSVRVVDLNAAHPSPTSGFELCELEVPDVVGSVRWVPSKPSLLSFTTDSGMLNIADLRMGRVVQRWVLDKYSFAHEWLDTDGSSAVVGFGDGRLQLVDEKVLEACVTLPRFRDPSVSAVGELAMCSDRRLVASFGSVGATVWRVAPNMRFGFGGRPSKDHHGPQARYTLSPRLKLPNIGDGSGERSTPAHGCGSGQHPVHGVVTVSRDRDGAGSQLQLVEGALADKVSGTFLRKRLGSGHGGRMPGTAAADNARDHGRHGHVLGVSSSAGQLAFFDVDTRAS